MNKKIVYPDIFSAAWSGFKSHCWLLMGLLIGFTIIYSLLILFTIPAKGETIRISGIIVAVICFFFFCFFVMGYLKNCLQSLNREEPQFSAYGQASRGLLSFIPAYLLFVVAVSLGCTLFLLPGIYLFLRFQFFFISMVDEETGVIDSFKRSWYITKGHTLQLFVLMLFQKLILIIGLVAFGAGIFAAIPLIILMYAQTYRNLTAPAM